MTSCKPVSFSNRALHRGVSECEMNTAQRQSNEDGNDWNAGGKHERGGSSVITAPISDTPTHEKHP